MNVCLPPSSVERFTQALKSGKLNPERLSRLTSEERRALFESVVGKGEAEHVNAEFETKLLLKNQQRGMITWAKNVAGLKPVARRDLLSRISKLDRVLDPAEEKAFMKDLAAQKLGFGVSSSEAKTIMDMSRKVQELESKQRSDGTFPTEAQRMAYGRAKVHLGEFLGETKLEANKLRTSDFKANPVESIGRAADITAGTAKAVKAAFDDSALFRQGFKTMLSHPGIWGRNVRKNVMDLYKQGIKGQDVMREAKADVLSRPNAKYYEKMGIAPKVEEEFGDPSLIMKIPGIGRFYKTTEAAFNAFMLRTRADLADHYLDIAKKADINLEDTKQLKPIGNMIGSLTGRANLGRLEQGASSFNNVFFAPRFVKSQVDTLLHPLTGAGGSNFVRKEAAKNLVKIVGGTAAIMATANAIRPGSVELDPRSSNFGKIKVGDTTFDVTGGFAPIAVLAARLYTHQYKSGSKGTITELGSNPMAPTGQDVVSQFLSGKLSPAANRVWVNLITKQEFNGAKPTLASNAQNLFEPLPASTYTDAKSDPHAANALVTEAADALGIAANTNNPANQVKPLSKTDTALKQKIGGAKFQQYQDQYNNRLTSFLGTNYYKSLPNDQKQPAYTRAEATIKKNLYKQYGFKLPKRSSNKSFNSRVDQLVK